MNSALFRSLAIYAIILPLAVFVGWMSVDLGNWDRTSFASIATVIFVLLLPALLKWHYPLMLFSWNTSITIFFIKGNPAFWMIMVAINVGLAFLNRIIQKRQAFLPAPSVSLPLLALLVVVVITSYVRGGFGLQILGSAIQGGKAYVSIVAGILGFFAMASVPVPREKGRYYLGLFILPGLIAMVSNLIYYAGPSFYFLYLLFPIGFASVQAVSDMATGSIARVAGFSASATTMSLYLLAMFGVRGVVTKWWRLLLLLAALAVGAMGGYRSMFVTFAIIFALLFVLEGLIRSPIFPILTLAGLLGFAGLVTFVHKLPLSAQRALSILPLEVDRVARVDAKGSLEWRVQMWQLVIPQLPNYFWVGKGYVIDPTALYLTQQAQMRGRIPNYSASLLAGDYHNGPLSVYVPLGFFGSLTFLAFLFTSIRATYLNYIYGAESLKTANRFIFAFFLTKVLFFFVVFGSLHSDLYQFTGLVGLSVALNHGICQVPVTEKKTIPFRSIFKIRQPETAPGAA